MTDQPERQPDLCQASISNEHSDGTQYCTLPAAHHGGEYGQHHASPNHPKIGRLCWTDTAIGAVPHQDAPGRLDSARAEIPECLHDSCTMGCTTECRAVINAAWRHLNPSAAEPHAQQHAGHGSPCETSPDGSCASPTADQFDCFSAAPPMAGQISITGSDGQPLVTIHIDEQHLEYGPGYEPDEAAQAFWEAMRLHMPSPMVQQYGQPLTDTINAELKAGQEAQQALERVRSLANEMLQAQHGVDLEADGVRRAVAERIRAALTAQVKR